MKSNASQVFPHGADYGVRGSGRTLEEAFENGARAMFSIGVESLESVRPVRWIPVRGDAADAESLFVEWLNALLAAASIEGIVLGDCRVRIGGTAFEGEGGGEPFDAARHDAGTEVKGATYTELRVGREGDRFVAQCVVDV